MERWKELVAKAEASHGIVTRTELLGAGMSPTQVERWRRLGRLVATTRGVYRIGGAPSTFAGQVTAAISAFEGETWVSHHSAARLWGLGVASRHHLVEVTRPHVLSAQRAGVRVHRSTSLPGHHVTSLHGVPLTTPARTLFDLARTTGPRRLDRAVERATQARLCTVASVYRVLYDLGGRGRPGTRRLREVLARWDEDEPATESELDAVGRALLAPVPGIEWQVEVSDEQGYVRRVDAAVATARLVIEFDGAAFHASPAARARDDHQDRRLLRQGWRVRRLSWGDLTRRADLTLAEVLDAVRSASAPRTA